MSSPTISPIHTACKSCEFAIYEDKTQTECYLGFVDRFKIADVEVLEVYDEDKEFYVINNKKCVGYREFKYFVNRGLSETGIQEKAEYVRDRLKINYDLTINIRNYSAAELQELAKEISKLSIKPNSLHIVRYKEDREKYSYRFIEKIISSTKVTKWKIKTLLDNSEEFLTAVHHIINENKSTKFMLSINKNFSKIAEMVDYAQKTIYDNLSTFVVITEKTKECFLFSTDVYRLGILNGVDILSETDKYTII